MNKAPLAILPIPALQDNYIWLAYFPGSSECFVVDPGTATPVLEYLQRNHLVLTSILITHHHWDHTHGIFDLLEQYPDISIFGPAHEPTQHQTHHLNEGDRCVLLQQGYTLNIYQVLGHTKGHIVYYGKDFQNQLSLFCGDTLFSGGCGRLLEGTPSQLYHSLIRLRNLPEQTQIYCGHEYTINNLQFAQWLEPDNINIGKALENAQSNRAALQATLPSSIGKEKIINPFFKCDNANFVHIIQNRFSVALQTPVEAFAFIRKLKDQWSNRATTV